jgi:plasmid maintenance system antidote protein VapI
MTGKELIGCTMRPIHPGEILREQRGVSADTALRLGRYFGTSPEFWMDLQSDYGLRRARQEVGHTIAQAVCPQAT